MLEGLNIKELARNFKLNVSLEGWHAAISILGICATWIGMIYLKEKLF